jgi:hypothetical protein
MQSSEQTKNSYEMSTIFVPLTVIFFLRAKKLFSNIILGDRETNRTVVCPQDPHHCVRSISSKELFDELVKAKTEGQQLKSLGKKEDAISWGGGGDIVLRKG